jgi:hypothetical protein
MFLGSYDLMVGTVLEKKRETLGTLQFPVPCLGRRSLKMSSLQEMEAHKGMDKPSLGETGVPLQGFLCLGWDPE